MQPLKIFISCFILLLLSSESILAVKEYSGSYRQIPGSSLHEKERYKVKGIGKFIKWVKQKVKTLLEEKNERSSKSWIWWVAGCWVIALTLLIGSYYVSPRSSFLMRPFSLGFALAGLIIWVWNRK